MRQIPDESVDTVITSPPYWGLRDYGGDGKVWGNRYCERADGETYKHHEWEGYTRPSENTRKNNNSLQLKSAYWKPQDQAFCKHCDAWFGQLGLEPTHDQYVKNMVKVFDEVKRILKPEGTLWLNLGDSYCAGSRKSNVGQTMHEGDERTLPTQMRNQASGSLKSKDLVGIPWRVALALQEAGWWLRQDIIWAKPNCMPESVKDRCTKNHEYMFLLTKSAHYYFDHEAIKEPIKDISAKRMLRGMSDNHKTTNGAPGQKPHSLAQPRLNKTKTEAPDFEKTRNKRSVWWVSPKPFSEAHFAVFPIDLIEPCVLAGSPVGGTVFDPFGGSGTTAIAAIKHGRKAILTELSPDYVKIAEKRISDFKRATGLDKEGVEWL